MCPVANEIGISSGTHVRVDNHHCHPSGNPMANTSNASPTAPVRVGRQLIRLFRHQTDSYLPDTHVTLDLGESSDLPSKLPHSAFPQNKIENPPCLQLDYFSS